MILLKDTKEISFSDIPTSPGVYIMKDQNGEVIYVGKAVNLRNRIRQYFSISGDSRFSIRYLVPQIYSIDYIVTSSEKEAFLLENTLIKHHKPKFNIDLRDDKSFLGIRIDTKQDFPRIELVRIHSIKKDNALYFGPFSSGKSVREMLRLINKYFPLRRCTAAAFKHRSRPCLMYQIKQCLGPCSNLVNKDQYHTIVKQIILLLQGKSDELIKELTVQMNEYSQMVKFEEAAAIRDKIFAIKSTIEQQYVTELKNRNRDIIVHYMSGEMILIIVLFYRAGSLVSHKDFQFKIYDQTQEEIFYSFISQFYSPRRYIPEEVITSAAPQEKELLEEWLTDQCGKAVHILTPQRGEKRKLIELALKNAEEIYKIKKDRVCDTERILHTIQEKLLLTKLPLHIECFDVSNIQGKMAYGSLVCFNNAEPSKNDYRLFRIKTVSGSDDFAMMHEVIFRRYKRSLKEGIELPDLIIVDGGKGQLNSAVEVFKELGIKQLNIVGMAKIKTIKKSEMKQCVVPEKSEERFFLPNRKNPIILRKGSAPLLLLQRIRDEAHRFAITHHKKLRKKAVLTSALDSILQIGDKRKKALLKYFGSVEKIKRAQLEELEQSGIVPKSIARKIYEFFHI